MNNKEKKENILEPLKINEILSNTLGDVYKRKISLKRAQMISRLALALSKNIENVELQKRIEVLESVFKK